MKKATWLMLGVVVVLMFGGEVYAQQRSSEGPDLLTSSATPGHAMKVSDYGRSQGAILGKAMTGLSEGRGLVLMLVSLQ